MDVGLGLPSEAPGVSAPLLLEWAKRADGGPFSTLSVTDRVVWSTFEPFATLAAAAAVTTRVRLMTAIAIAPLRGAALLAKSATTVDALSGGRFVLGLGIGPRADDYAAADADFAARGRRFDGILERLRPTLEAGSPIGPAAASPHGPEIAIGGLSDRAFVRMARYADGYVHGGGPPKAFAAAADKARAAWADAGRPGYPRLRGQAYFALGSDAVAERAREALRAYYAFLGPFSERIAEGLLATPHAIARVLRGYEDAGCDELLFFPALAELDQLERLEDVLAAVRPPAETAS